MRVLVFGDIHANFEALSAVLGDAGAVDGVISLGDLVGYGPNPNECVDRVRAMPNLTGLVGNHDLAAIGKLDLSMFNDHARVAAEWTDSQLDPGVRSYLASLESAVSTPQVHLAHASPRDPVWEYMESPPQGPPSFRLFRQYVCFVGHTHVPRVFIEADIASRASKVVQPAAGTTLELADGSRRIVNPGGVGQPRDGDPRAAYGLYDDESGLFTFRRVSYPYEETQRKIRAAKLPEVLAYRLAFGM